MRRSMIWSLVGIVTIAVLSLGATVISGHTPLLGLDLKGGVSVVLKPQGTVDNATLSQAVTIIQRRVDGLGVANSNVARQGKDVVVSLPGIKNSQNALKVLGTTATLYFRPLYCAIPTYAPPKGPSSTTPKPAQTTPTPPSRVTPGPGPAPVSPAPGAPQGAGSPAQERLNVRLAAGVHPVGAPTPTVPPTPTPATPTPATPVTPGGTGAASPAPECSASNAASLPSTSPAADTRTATVIVPASPTSGYPSTTRFVLGPADLTGQGVATSGVSTDQTTGAFVVDLTFNSAGSKAFDAMAAVRNKFYVPKAQSQSPQSQEAIELDGVLESAPTIEQSSFNGRAQISGSFTAKQANNLSLELRYGSLPVRFAPQSVQTVSATIGSDSLKAGLLAGLGGIILVMLYMVLYYRALGLVVLIGLGVGAALLYSIITELSQTSSLALTLSGVTGIIVSIGITVDSYVVYFERLKDEVRGGRSIRQSTERSFARAFRTVLTADFVSFLAALILYELTVGNVKGFAFTLGLSTLLDVFTAYFFIRPMVVMVGRRRTFTDNRILGVARGLGTSPAGSMS